MRAIFLATAVAWAGIATAQADTTSIPAGTVTATTELPLQPGVFGGAAVSGTSINAQLGTTTITGSVTGLSDPVSVLAQIGLIPVSAWDPVNGSAEEGVYVVPWYDGFDWGMSLGSWGTEPDFAYPLSTPMQFTITLEPTPGSGGTMTLEVGSETLGPFAYTGDFSNALLAVQVGYLEGHAVSFGQIQAVSIVPEPASILLVAASGLVATSRRRGA